MALSSLYFSCQAIKRLWKEKEGGNSLNIKQYSCLVVVHVGETYFWRKTDGKRKDYFTYLFKERKAVAFVFQMKKLGRYADILQPPLNC